MSEKQLVGSIRAKDELGVCAIGRLIVHPNFQGRGIGSKLLGAIEARFSEVRIYELFTGSTSVANIRLYQKPGYTISVTRVISPAVSPTCLVKAGPQRLSR